MQEPEITPRELGADSTQPFDAITSGSAELRRLFDDVVQRDVLTWSVTYNLIRQIGKGGQSVVFLADRSGAYDSKFRLAVKLFTPDAYTSSETYQAEMSRIAHVSMVVAKIQQDNLLDVHNIVMFNDIQAMVMEWVNGFDLHQLLQPGVLDRLKPNVDAKRWEYINDVVVTATDHQLRFKPGIAISILREVLAGLAALHRKKIVHADLKPSNIMIKRTGNTKVIDYGSAFLLDELPQRQTWTPRYAAVELLEGADHSTFSDLASLGYVLLEMLTGSPPFPDVKNLSALIQAKRELPDQIEELLPSDIVGNETLVELIRRLIDPAPEKRFPSAESADMLDSGAAEFQRQLVKAGLDTEYENDLRVWLQDFGRSATDSGV